MTSLLRSVTLNAQGGGSGVLLNGEPFPYWVSEDIDIEPGGRGGVTIVNLPLIVDGVVLIVDHKGKRRVIDGAFGDGLGDVGEWARQHVRQELEAAFPWLRLEPDLGPIGRRLKTLDQLATDIAEQSDLTKAEALHHLEHALAFDVTPRSTP